MRLEPVNEHGYLICPEDPGELGLESPRWSVNEVEGRILAEFCKDKDVLEIGTGLGVSTWAIAKTASVVYTVDVDEWVHQEVVLPKNSKRFYDVPKDIVVDVAFIDGLHTEDQCLIDIHKAKFVLRQGGMFIFHDVNMQGVKNAIKRANLIAYGIGTPAGMAIAWND